MAEIIKSELESFDYSFLVTSDGSSSGPITGSVCGSINNFVNNSNNYLTGSVGNMIRDKYMIYSEATKIGSQLSTKLFETINAIINSILNVFSESKYDISSLDLKEKPNIEKKLADLIVLIASSEAKYYSQRETTKTKIENGVETSYSYIEYPYQTPELAKLIADSKESKKQMENLLTVLGKLENEIAKAKVAIEEMNQEIAKFKSQVNSIIPSKETYFLANESYFGVNVPGIINI